MYRKNVSGQYIGFAAINVTTGAAMTGTTGFAAYRVLDGTQATATGSVSDKANGQYSFALSQADTNGNNCSIIFTMTNMVPVEKTFVTTACDPTTATNFGITSLPTTACTTNASLLTSGTSTAQISTSSGQVILQSGTGTGQLNFTSGVVNSNSVQWLGGTIPAVNVTGVPKVDIVDILGTATAGTAGYMAPDWAHIGAPTSTVALSGTTIGTLTTYTGNTPQTGDSYARIGAAGAGLTAITGVTLGATQTGVTIPTVTTLTNLPAITSNWLTGTGVDSTAVTKIQSGLATPTNITAGTITTTTSVTNPVTISAGTGAGQLSITSGVVDANVAQIAASTTAATNLQAEMLAIFTGVVSADSAATTTSFTANTSTSTGLSTTPNFYDNSIIAFWSGTDEAKAVKVTGYTVSGSVGTFTLSAGLATAPSTSDKFILLGYSS